ncbi:MAG: hypothetical protein R3178_04800 [Rhodothermales bacterium]|nr:hypothetical protein [Rhodothermales bacterium]
MDFLRPYIDTIMAVGADYGVNPFVFATIYVGAVPFFTASVAWLIRNLRRRRPITLPVLSAGFFFVSAYLYLLVAGRNIPLWVYGLVGAMLAYGTYSTVKKIKQQTTSDHGA